MPLIAIILRTTWSCQAPSQLPLAENSKEPAKSSRSRNYSSRITVPNAQVPLVPRSTLGNDRRIAQPEEAVSLSWV